MIKDNFHFKVLNSISFVMVILINFLANYLPINGYNTGELSDMYPNLFVPAGVTFSIWGLIYLLLAIFIVAQFISFKGNINQKKEEIIEKIGIFFFISSLANIGWIFTWHNLSLFFSLVFMLIILLSLIKIYNNLEIGKKNYSLKLYSIFILPFSIYLGWISVATIANVTTLLVDLNWNGFGLSEVFWTILVIIVGLILALLSLLLKKDIAYSLVIVWAYLGIVIKRYMILSDPIMSIVYVASVSIVLILISIFNIKARNIKE
ncbi:MAG: hypothetical protein K9K32_03310 [Halanaerobiales bacterium]|nr:hypothetical protein [Halanaerobiales bacterium]